MKWLTIFALLLPNTGATPEVEVITKSEDSYQVTGRMFLTHDFVGESGTARTAASCIGCKWHLQPICPDPINRQIDGEFDCTRPAGFACSNSNQNRFQVWFLAEGLWRPSDWRRTGTVCLGPAGPKSIQQLQQEVTQTAIGVLPKLSAVLRPKQNSLVNLPTKVSVKSPKTFTFSTQVAGIAVTVSATATYRYVFADGNSYLTTAQEVSNIYKQRGSYPIQVTAIWQATWSSNLHGSNPVATADLTQTVTLPAVVLAARGRLISR